MAVTRSFGVWEMMSVPSSSALRLNPHPRPARSLAPNRAISLFCAPCITSCEFQTIMPAARRFPRPWTSEETEACFIVKDSTGRALAYVYYEEEPGRRTSANLLTKDEARRVASNIAKLPNFRMGGARS